MSLYHDIVALQENSQTVYDLLTTDIIDYETGEVIEPSEDDLRPLLDMLNEESSAIVEHIAEEILKSEAQVEFYKTRERDISSKRKRIESRIENAKSYIMGLMESKMLNELHGETIKFKIARSKYVDVQCAVDEIPDDYIKISPEVKSPDKTKLKKALDSGVKINGIEIKERAKVNIK